MWWPCLVQANWSSYVVRMRNMDDLAGHHGWYQADSRRYRTRIRKREESLCLVASEMEATNPWWLDAGIKCHVMGDPSVLHDFQRMSPRLAMAIEIGNGNILRAEGYGNVVPTNKSDITVLRCIFRAGIQAQRGVRLGTDGIGFRISFDKNEAIVSRGNITISATK